MTIPRGTIEDFAEVRLTDSVAEFLAGGSVVRFIIIDCGGNVFRVLPFMPPHGDARTFADLLDAAMAARAVDVTLLEPSAAEDAVRADGSIAVVIMNGEIAGVFASTQSRGQRSKPPGGGVRDAQTGLSFEELGGGGTLGFEVDEQKASASFESASPPSRARRRTRELREMDQKLGGGKGMGAGTATGESTFGGTLGFETAEAKEAPLFEPAPSPPPPPPSPEPMAAAPIDKVSTFFNAELESHDDRVPLTMGTAYVLAFFTGEKASEVTAAVPIDVPFAPSDTESELTIQLTSDDFDIEQPSLPLRVKRDGKSRGRARFDVTPKRNGRGTIVAVVMKGGNFINKTTLEINVGNAASSAVGNVTSVGRAFAGDERVRERDLLLILEQDHDSFELTISKEVTARAKIPLTAQHLDAIVITARKTLKEIVDTIDLTTAKRPYQDRLKIPDDIHRASLKKLAEAGFILFRELFFPPAADAQLRNIGKRFIEIVSGDPMAIQIVTTRFFIPWPLLYVADRFDPANIDPNRFLGFRHRIEQIPLQNGFNVTEPEIRHEKNLVIGVNVNRDIDKDMKAPFVADQLAFFDGVNGKHAVVSVRDARDTIQSVLLDPEMKEQIVYFFCHAVSKSLAEGGPDESMIGLTNKEMLKLRDLRLADSTDPAPYRTTPLFIINACQSAELSPLFYDGFMPYLMAKGARGVIGTECDTPAIFAVEWAQRFFRQFLEGAELGEVVLALRKQFLEQENNVMGLLYAVHCNGNTRIHPALGLTAD